MNLDRRLVSLAVAFFALFVAQWLFFPVYILVLTQGGLLLVMLRV